jgi:hypothetical protein
MGWRLSKGKSRRKIDAAIALAMAVDRATRKTDTIPEPGFFVVEENHDLIVGVVGNFVGGVWCFHSVHSIWANLYRTFIADIHVCF